MISVKYSTATAVPTLRRTAVNTMGHDYGKDMKRNKARRPAPSDLTEFSSPAAVQCFIVHRHQYLKKDNEHDDENLAEVSHTEEEQNDRKENDLGNRVHNIDEGEKIRSSARNLPHAQPCWHC